MILQHFLKVRSIRTPKWSSLENETFLISYDESGVAQVWEKSLASTSLAQRSFFDNFILGIETHPQTEQAVFSMSEGGNEKFQLFHIKGQKVTNITNNPEASHYLGPFYNEGKNLFYTANDRDFAHFDLYSLELESGTKTCLLENHDNYNFPEAVSPDGRYFLYRKLKAEDDQGLWIYDYQTKETKELSSQKAKYLTPKWSEDSKGFYFLTNVEAEFQYVAHYELESGRITPVYRPEWDVETIDLSFDGRYLAMVINEDGFSRLAVFDIETQQMLNTPLPPKGEIAFYDSIDWSPSGYRLLFTLSSGSRPSNVWMLDLEKDTIKRVTDNQLEPDIRDGCVDAELHHFESFDGLTVPYWLYVPKGMKTKKMPVLIEIHGGPEGQEKPAYNDMIQYLISEGIAVVAPNVRGSTGYGKTYTHLDDVEKRLDSVKDIESLVQHLTETGLADPEKIAVSGTSYGGFMSLSCAARLSELFCAAVDNVGMYNLVTFLENTASYRRAHRESEYGSLEWDRELLYEVSPVAKVDDIKGPLMVIHGANDPRVPVSEAEQVVDYLTEKGVQITYLRYEDEGHGLHKYENKLDCFEKMGKFLKQSMNL